jgi:hypothetical protein
MITRDEVEGDNLFTECVIITLTPSLKGSMFFYYTECLMIQVCIMLLEGQLLKK